MKNKYYIFKREDLEKIKETLSKTTSLFAPFKDSSGNLSWGKDKDLFGNYYGNTLLSPKQFFFPQTDQLLILDNEKSNYGVKLSDKDIEPTTLWGVRPCDLKAIEILDKIFLAGDKFDRKYKERRDKAFLIGLFCEEPYETCFCTSLGYDLLDSSVSDLLFIETGENEFIGAVSNKGDDILKQANVDKKEASPANLKKLEKKISDFKKKFKINFKLGKKLKDLHSFFEDDSFFEKVSFKCLECGICSFLCPTCHCFSIMDRMCKEKGERMRCWDCCMYSDFTLMAGGHNPRATIKPRVRQRFLHKGYYMQENYSELGCVGCGRCLAKCPVSMDIVEGLKHVCGEES